MNSLLFLGTGASSGVPVITCDCDVCQSDLSYNKRMRTSALIKREGRQFLIDAGQDLRSQALLNRIKRLDGLLLTHAHHDHISGLDDLRAFRYKSKKPLPTLLSKETAAEVTKRYDYIFNKPSEPLLELRLLPNDEGEVLFEGVPITYVSFEQGGMKVNGFRVDNLAYLSDIHTYPNTIFNWLKGVDILVVSALRYTPSNLHFSVDDAVDFINKVGARQGWLTHLSHELDHEKTNAYLPPHIRLAYDGLEITFG